MCLENYYYIDSKTVYDALIALCSSVKIVLWAKHLFYSHSLVFKI